MTKQFPSGGLLLGKTAGGSKLLFTADDFRNIQLAIAAIAAGIDTLLEEAGISSSEVSHIYLGGGFGFHITREDCQTLGLFSTLDCNHLEPVGNSCLQGLFLCATEQIPLSCAGSVVKVNLAEHPYFQERFVSHMNFPN